MQQPTRIPAAPFIKFKQDGSLFIELLICQDCGKASLRSHLACPHCGSRTTPTSRPAANSGVVETCTVVMRSYPGVRTPFTSAVVRLDDGPLLKGVLRGEPADDIVHRVGQRVKVVFDDANGAKDATGSPYVCFFFEPLQGFRHD